MEEIIFDGKRFTRFGDYWRSARKFLHRAIYEKHYGPIPKGFHIHHKDHNKNNNAPENLELKSGRQHLSDHQKGHGRYPHAALAGLKVWRQTDAGRAFAHSMGKRNQHFMRSEASFTCECCSKQFVAQIKGTNRFCSNACKARQRRKDGADRIDANCILCHKAFKADRFKPSVCCSRSCGRKMWMATPEGKAHQENITRIASEHRAAERCLLHGS